MKIVVAMCKQNDSSFPNKFVLLKLSHKSKERLIFSNTWNADSATLWGFTTNHKVALRCSCLIWSIWQPAADAVCKVRSVACLSQSFRWLLISMSLTMRLRSELLSAVKGWQCYRWFLGSIDFNGRSRLRQLQFRLLPPPITKVINPQTTQKAVIGGLTFWGKRRVRKHRFRLKKKC